MATIIGKIMETLNIALESVFTHLLLSFVTIFLH